MEITCLLNPGVFRLNGKTWLLLRVAERPIQEEGIISFPVYNEKGEIEVLRFSKDDPALDATDPRVIKYKGQNYLTTLSYLRPVCSLDDVHFVEDPALKPRTTASQALLPAPPRKSQNSRLPGRRPRHSCI
jgi:hypothetical protein